MLTTSAAKMAMIMEPSAPETPNIPVDTYLTPYRDAHDEHGSSFGVTLWGSPRTQVRRFEVFAQLVYLHGKRVLDAGCSRGDFAAWMIQQDIKYDRYVGVDGLDEVIAYARRRNLPRATFYSGDFLTQPALLRKANPQVIVISGTLNTMDDEQVFQTLEAAWQATGETLLFNFLSDRVGSRAAEQRYPSRRLDTLRLLDWALRQTWAVQYRQDYFADGHDGTILMTRPAAMVGHMRV